MLRVINLFIINIVSHYQEIVIGRNNCFNKLLVLSFLCASFTFESCKKLVAVSEPVNTITTSETFSTEANATSAVIQVYNDLVIGGNYGFSFGNGFITTQAALSADELSYFDQTNTAIVQFQSNSLQSTNYYVNGPLWSAAYSTIYVANADIEGLRASTTISAATQKQLIGESEFLRAFIYFYLVNLYGDVPLVTTTVWSQTSLMARTSTSKVYQQIIVDLTDAISLLADDYAVSGGQRIRVNKYAASALLARVYLYLGDWNNAQTQANIVVNNSSYKLVGNLNNVFLANSSEAIWQLQINSNVYPYATQEGYNILPTSSTDYAPYYLTGQLFSAFETGDNRKKAWIDSTLYAGVTYYYPYKYKIRVGTQSMAPEYYMMLRVAEQYLIRAEAEAQLNNLSGAINDLNVIRTRAGLQPLSTSLTQAQILTAILQERRIELFAEWGHRWLDLKRIGIATAVLTPIKATWTSGGQLYPVPAIEIQNDPNLTQNPGY